MNYVNCIQSGLGSVIMTVIGVICFIIGLFCILSTAEEIEFKIGPLGPFKIKLPQEKTLGLTRTRMTGFFILTIGLILAIFYAGLIFTKCDICDDIPLSSIKIKISGSNTMSNIVNHDINEFLERYPDITSKSIGYTHENERQKMLGTEQGIKDLLVNDANIAAISRELTPSEEAQGLVAQKGGIDDIAVFIGVENPLKQKIINKGLTKEQLKSIYAGESINWDSLGFEGSNITKRTIKVWNLSNGTGTRDKFKEFVMGDVSFGQNLIELSRDEYSSWICKLKSDGIGYGSYEIIGNQSCIEFIPIITYNHDKKQKIKPKQDGYPFRRDLYYAYKTPETYKKQDVHKTADADTCSVKKFLDFVTKR